MEALGHSAGGQAAGSAVEVASPAPDPDGELSDAALDAVVGGLTADAALARAAAFDLTLRLPAN